MRMPLLMQASSTVEGLETLTLVSFQIADPILPAAKSRGNEQAITRDPAGARALRSRLRPADNSPRASRPRGIRLYHKGEARPGCPRRLRGKFSRFRAPRRAKDDAAEARPRARARALSDRPRRSKFRPRRLRSATSENRARFRARRRRARHARSPTGRTRAARSRFRSIRPERSACAVLRALLRRAAAAP